MNDQHKRKNIYKKLKNKFRLILMNDNTFEERFSLILSPFNLFTWGGLAILVIAMLVFCLIALTPLRELIPGYGEINIRKMAIMTSLKADSIEKKINPNKNYISNIMAILKGESIDTLNNIQKDSEADYSKVDLSPSVEDSLFRAEIEAQSEYNLLFKSENRSSGIRSYFFFTPIDGLVTADFDPTMGHFGIDLTAPANEAVMATLDGVVILAAWTSETGHIIAIQHRSGLISVYKHNAILLKRTGDRVKAGEPIAIIGESGELSNGPHLHFELWVEGRPIDPKEHMEFKSIQ